MAEWERNLPLKLWFQMDLKAVYDGFAIFKGWHHRCEALDSLILILDQDVSEVW